jgi:radical SAM protein with 4Fe4S-binding SPASM domain
LFHPHLEEMVRLATERELGTRIHTNATLLDQERAKRLLESSPDLVSFSFDGYDKATYEAVRIGANFEKTLENISFFLSERRRMGLKKPYTVIQIIEPWDITEEYRRNLQKFGETVRAMGLDKFYVKRPHNWAGNAPGEAGTGNTLIPCTFLFYSMTILWDGTVCPCPQDWYGSMVLGNLNEQSLNEIWNGEPIRTLRRRMFRRDLSGLLCEQCDRIRRNTWMGIPVENAKAFLGETLAGYRWVGRLIKR